MRGSIIFYKDELIRTQITIDVSVEQYSNIGFQSEHFRHKILSFNLHGFVRNHPSI
jgi:hypothetical protein